MKISQKFIATETPAGLWLFLATALAILWSNSFFHESYEAIIHSNFIFKIANFTHSISLTSAVNNGLMTLFFFLIGLEIKRELTVGELNSIKKAILPAIAAAGGMLVPALIYLALNLHDSIGIRGWAIPTATDIAFSLGVLSLLNHRIPISLKIFLTALAIFDDLGAVLIIAIFYTQKILWFGLAFAAFCQIVLIALNKLDLIIPILFLLLGILIWSSLLISGVHPTLAGILVAFTIPLKTSKIPHTNPLKNIEEKLHPWVAFFILPVFAFTNAGISLQGFLESLITPISLGIMFGLFIGKQLGIMSFCWLAIKTRVAQFPRNMNWKNLYGVSLLCGIGFTMSFFIGFLSFGDLGIEYQNYLRIGVLLGSLLSGTVGYLYLHFLTKV